MTEPASVVDIFLQPGDIYLGERDTRIRTVLGSCVSLVLWHPQALLGGMLHYMLPRRTQRETGALDARYGDEAMELMRRDIDAAGVPLREFRVHLFGGGNMFPRVRQTSHWQVGRKNVEAARHLIRRFGLSVSDEHVEGNGHRHLIFNVWNGDILLRYAEAYPYESNTMKGLRA